MLRLLWLILGILISAGSAIALEVTVLPAVVVNSEQVYIGDVATIVPASQRLSTKQITRAPALGQQLTINRDQIKQVLTQNGISAAEIKFSGATAVTVKRDSLVITAQRIQRDIDSYLHDVQHRTPETQFKFTMQGNINDITVPAGNLQVEVIPSNPAVIGSRRFTLIYSVDGRTVRNQSVSGKLEVLSNVVVVQRNLRRGSIVKSDDVRLVTVDIGKVDQPFFSLDEVVGKKVVRSMRSGEVVEAQNLDYPPLVKKGAFVKLVARRGQMVLTATGVAMEDGKMAEFIQVRNSASQKDVLAKVIGLDQVEVGF
ncbi:MAG: flagellar basal body P-ring formation chaperone FlgA [Desulfuromonas sp.]|nr:flagellar basal body P-ring formation chaperone FlgA [Desulfuromonas sp.]